MFQQGNKEATKREVRSGGRKTIKQEVEEARELITQEALLALANSKVYKQMVKTNDDEMVDYVRTKEMALPITLKGMIERKDLTSGGKPIPLLQGITNNKDVHTDNSASETPEAEKEDQSRWWRHRRQ